jgi:hypothetical protein
VGGGGDHLARINGQSSARQLLVDRRRKMTRRWAGPQLGRARKGREGRGIGVPAQFGLNPLFSYKTFFSFSVFLF